MSISPCSTGSAQYESMCRRLNERHDGALSGLNKKLAVVQYGHENVTTWRRSYAVRPPPTDRAHPYYLEPNPLNPNSNAPNRTLCFQSSIFSHTPTFSRCLPGTPPQTPPVYAYIRVCVCVFVCVCERERERERESSIYAYIRVSVYVYLCRLKQTLTNVDSRCWPGHDSKYEKLGVAPEDLPFTESLHDSLLRTKVCVCVWLWLCVCARAVSVPVRGGKKKKRNGSAKYI
jgi:hypothetical protein